MDQTYPEPSGEALSYSSQRAAQLTSLVITFIQVYTQHRARQERRQAARDHAVAAELARAEHAARQQAQATWAAACDPAWLGRADLFQTARAWGAAMPYATADPDAAVAMSRCEDRLRAIHPYAMARYGRLRAEGTSPFDAMRQTVPLFARHPDPRPGQPAPARHLDAVPAGWPATQPPGPAPAPAGPEPTASESAEERGREIIARLKASARAARRGELGPGGLATVLEATTNLPPEIISRLTSPSHPATGTVPAERSPARLAAESFPHSAADAIRAAAATAGSAQPAVRTVTVRPLRRPRHRP